MKPALRRMLATLRRRRLPVLAIVLAAVGVAGWQIAHRTPVYRATATIQLHRRLHGRHALPGEETPAGGQSESGELFSLKSDDLLRQVARDLHLLDSPPPRPGMTEGERLAAMARFLQSGLYVYAEPDTSLVTITFTSTDGQFAADVVNRVADDFIDRTYRRRFQAVQRTAGWRESQLGALKAETEASEQEMLERQRQLGLPGFNTAYNKVERGLGEMLRDADKATADRIAAEARYEQLQHAAPEQLEAAAVPSGGARQMLARGRTALATAREEEAELLATLGPRHPRVLAVRASIASLEEQHRHDLEAISGQAYRALVSARDAEAATRAAFDARQAEVYGGAQQNVLYVKAQRQFLEDRYLYTQLYLLLRSTSFEAGLASPPIDVVDRAYAGTPPLVESAWLMFFRWLLLGLGGGVAVALAAENIRLGLTTLDDVEELTELPGLALLPDAGSLPGMTMTVLREPDSAFATGIDALAGRLLYPAGLWREGGAGRPAPEPPRILVVTSATPSEGKTTVACNLAILLASGGRKVLLIDADLRRPSVHHRLGLSGQYGLSTLLTGRRTFAEALQHLAGVPTLDILASGPIPPVSATLLQSAEFKALLDRADADYACVVVDSPPVLAVADSAQIARQGDAVVVVVRAGRTAGRTVRHALTVLRRAGAPLAGVVLNGLRVPKEKAAAGEPVGRLDRLDR